MTAFRLQCEKTCQDEIEGRVVMIVAQGSDVETKATVTKTRLYQHLTEAATLMSFYAVKNTKLCHIYEGMASPTASLRWTSRTLSGTSSPSI